MASTDFSMIVRHPEEGLKRHDLSGESITVGRGPDNDIQILVSEVSVQHAEFSRAGDGFRLADKGSTNGTSMNDEKIGAAGVDVAPMSKAILGSTIDVYFVPTAVLESTSMEDLARDIDENSSKPKTAPVASVAPAGVKPPIAIASPAPPASGAQTVRLDEVNPGVKPGAPALPAKPGPPQPGAPAPAAPKLAPMASPSALKPTPGAPAPAAPQLAPPAGPAAPKSSPGAPPKLAPPASPGAPKPVPGGTPPAAPKLPTPSTPVPGGAPPTLGVAQPAAPVPLKRPAPSGGPPPPPGAPNAPKIALPKSPPKPEDQ